LAGELLIRCRHGEIASSLAGPDFFLGVDGEDVLMIVAEDAANRTCELVLAGDLGELMIGLLDGVAALPPDPVGVSGAAPAIDFEKFSRGTFASGDFMTGADDFFGDASFAGDDSLLDLVGKGESVGAETPEFSKTMARLMGNPF
jgi:hypothetical protein